MDICPECQINIKLTDGRHAVTCVIGHPELSDAASFVDLHDMLQRIEAASKEYDKENSDPAVKQKSQIIVDAISARSEIFINNMLDVAFSKYGVLSILIAPEKEKILNDAMMGVNVAISMTISVLFEQGFINEESLMNFVLDESNDLRLD